MATVNLYLKLLKGEWIKNPRHIMSKHEIFVIISLFPHLGVYLNWYNNLQHFNSHTHSLPCPQQMELPSPTAPPASLSRLQPPPRGECSPISPCSYSFYSNTLSLSSSHHKINHKTHWATQSAQGLLAARIGRQLPDPIAFGNLVPARLTAGEGGGHGRVERVKQIQLLLRS